MYQIRLIFLIIVFSLCATNVFAENHYVRQGANGNGTDWANAYGSLPNTLVRGDTYYIADGEYGSYSFNDNANGSSYIYIKKATQSDHGTDTGWNATYGDGQAIFSSPLQFTTPYWVLDGVEWEGFVLTSNSMTGPCASCGSMYISPGGDFVTIRGVKFYGNYSASFGHTVGLAGKDTTFEYCHFYKTTYEDHFGGYPEGTLTIRNSVITMPDVPNDGSHRDIFNPEASGGWNLVFEKNIVYDIWLFGFLLQDSGSIGDIIIRYNVFSGFGHATFRLGSGNGGMGKATVYNNVFHNCLSLAIDNVTERNNIFSRTDGWTDMFGSSTVHASADSSQYNLYTPGTGSFQSGTGNINGGDAMFVNTSSPLGADGIPFTEDDGFNIKAGSAAIGAGVNVGLATDIRGNPVPSTPSIGAYEGTNTIPTAPNNFRFVPFP